MIKILFVEDDINLREIYAARLSAENYDIVVASDGEEALSKAIQEKPDIIVLDVMMPKISGFDVLDIIRDTPETKKMKVVMLTALSQESDRLRAEKMGVEKYLVKSQITLEDVVDAIKNALGEPSTAQSYANTETAQVSANSGGQSNVAQQTSTEPPEIHDVNTSSNVNTNAGTNTTDQTAQPREIESQIQTMPSKKQTGFNSGSQKQKSQEQAGTDALPKSEK